MVPPKQAWRTTPLNRNFTSSTTRGFDASKTLPKRNRSSGYVLGVKVGEKYGKLRNRVGKNKLRALGTSALLAPVVRGLLGSLLGKKKKQRGGLKTLKPWRVDTHETFLQRLPEDWSNGLKRVSNDELKAVTDIVRNIFDVKVALPSELLEPLKEVSKISALTTPLHQRRLLLSGIPALKDWIHYFTVTHGIE